MGIKIGMEPVHPGGFIKHSILPEGMSVTKAADVLGVGRPALSCLLNEKSGLSPEMALRVEKAFGVKMETMLRMQLRYDAFHMRQHADEIHVDRYEYTDAELAFS